MAVVCNSQLGTESMAAACYRKRKISTHTTYDHHIIDVEDLEKDNYKTLRAAMLKKRYANVIFKSQQQVLGEAFNGEEMKKKARLWERSSCKKRKPSRNNGKEIEKRLGLPFSRTVDFDDGLLAERDLLAIIGGQRVHILSVELLLGS